MPQINLTCKKRQEYFKNLPRPLPEIKGTNPGLIPHKMRRNTKPNKMRSFAAEFY